MEAPTDGDYLESSSVTFEWTVKGLKQLFDTTKGEAKSKVTRSMKFGGGRWQILLYPNAGPTKDKDGGAETTSAGSHLSLYLSCEPTVEEKEKALNDGKWARDGTYKFTFELTNTNKTTVYSVKEAHNHQFTFKTANWGWAQFARRDSVYYNSNQNKIRDAFIIVCTITSTLAPPSPPSLVRRKFVPKDLLDTVGTLLDDPTYSDIEFILPRGQQLVRNARRIMASKRIISRASYFNAMFNGSFAEAGGENRLGRIIEDDLVSLDDEIYSVIDEYNDSDEDGSEEYDGLTPMDGVVFGDAPQTGPHPENTAAGDDDSEGVQVSASTEGQPSGTERELSESETLGDEVIKGSTPIEQLHGSNPSGSKRQRVVVQDVAYTTYHAVLYWLYTDSIVFAPLSSSFSARNEDIASPPLPHSVQSQQNGEASVPAVTIPSVRSRREWIAQWKEDNPGNLMPCSPKSVYRLADRLDLKELKERAAHQIMKSLTVDNIAHEVFSPFAAAFDDIRKFEVDFFLKNWAKIRDSKAMRDVWQQIRFGHHPGFEEVWPVIVQNLVFVPPGQAAQPSESSGKS